MSEWLPMIMFCLLVFAGALYYAPKITPAIPFRRTERRSKRGRGSVGATGGNSRRKRLTGVQGAAGAVSGLWGLRPAVRRKRALRAV